MRWLGTAGLTVLLVACSGKHSGGGLDAAGGAGDDTPIKLPGAPPSQGAFAVSTQPLAPVPPGKACPAAGAFKTEVPTGGGLSGNHYMQKVVDGEDGAAVSCAITSHGGTFELSGTISVAGRSLRIQGGTVDEARHGSATITLSDAQNLPRPLVSRSCVLNFEFSAQENLQIKPGSAWASFSCPSAEAAPSDACTVWGYFVLENCAQ